MQLPDLSNRIPEGSVLGISYSGMHDASVAIVAPDGEPVFAVSLERLSRIKQDGRLPRKLLESLPWSRLSRAALSVSRHIDTTSLRKSETHPLAFAQPVNSDSQHAARFYEIENLIKCPIEYVPHHLSHAASAFWASGFDSALCLVYDGGMLNECAFGGLYAAASGQPIAPLDIFYASHYANIAVLYSSVTAVLGFTPVKHEGKITGLAAYGTPTDACRRVLTEWLRPEGGLQGLMEWKNIYEENVAPAVQLNEKKLDYLRVTVRAFSREEIAATVQSMAESHVLTILDNARKIGYPSGRICLAGGLFANVKINQRIAQSGVESMFVAPPMSDDGTALGAAWHLLSQTPGFRRDVISTMCLGSSYSPAQARKVISGQGVQISIKSDAANEIARRLAAREVVAVFQGSCEFGPRALGNRSILASATDALINRDLNARLGRTEFMPFAPVVRMQDADSCFDVSPGIANACRFMTVTVECKEALRLQSSAVVHVDNTARPQIITEQDNPFIHEVLSAYFELTGQKVLINTSFNVHEEPIVNSPEDALRGFFESGLDCLYFERVGFVDRVKNAEAEIRYLRQKSMIRSKGAGVREAAYLSNPTAPRTGMIAFSVGRSALVYLADGFHEPESWGVWSNGRYSRLAVPVELEGHEEVELHITIMLKPYEALASSAPVLRVSVDGHEVGYVLFRETTKDVRTIDFYARVRRSICEVEFELSCSNSPTLLSGSADHRELGFALCGIALVSAPVRNAGFPSSADVSETVFWA